MKLKERADVTAFEVHDIQLGIADALELLSEAFGQLLAPEIRLNFLFGSRNADAQAAAQHNNCDLALHLTRS